MKTLIFVLWAVLAVGSASAHADSWQPSFGHTQLPIWPGAIPDPHPAAGSEAVTSVEDRPVAGRPWVYVERVSQPTMTVYSPQGTNTGVAVVVFPGGGYLGFAIDLEGTEVCDWLTAKGITCVLLKYRVPFSGPSWDDGCECHITAKAPMAVEDAQRAMGLVRFHAEEWHIHPHKIGVLGFSARGHIVAAVSTHFRQRLYSAVGAADQESCRPDFAVALYPGHLSLAENTVALNPDIRTHTSRATPPWFLRSGSGRSE
jgi:acetyl esterase/lipase